MRTLAVAGLVAAALAVVASGLVASGEEPSPIVRGPIVSFDSNGAPTVDATFLEDAPAARVVARWRSKDEEVRRDFPMKTVAKGRRRATLEGAPPGAKVDYELLSGERSLGSHALKTIPEKGARSFTFAALGDSGWPSRKNKGAATEEQAGVAKILEDLAPDLVLHTGDVIYPFGQDTGLDPLFFAPYARTLARVPLFCCLGNHDIVTRKGAPELESFPYPPNPNENRYYSFDFASAHFVALDSNEPLEETSPEAFAASPQGKWLQADLAGTTAAWKVVFFHHPLYTCKDTRLSEVERMRRNVEPLLDAGGVDLVLSGHDHFYHRTHRVKRGERDERGIVHVLTGGGGASLYTRAPGMPETSVAFEKRHHVVRFEVAGASATLEVHALEADGTSKVVDRAAIASRRMR